jgi:hypothetical protein
MAHDALDRYNVTSKRSNDRRVDIMPLHFRQSGPPADRPAFTKERSTMKRAAFSSLLVICAAGVLAAQAPSTPAGQNVKVIGCLKGDGSKDSPWVLAGAVLPPPPGAMVGRGGPGPGGGRGAPPAEGGRGGREGGAPAAAPPPPPPPPPPQPPVNLRLQEVNMTPWRGLRVEVEGTLGPEATAGGTRELHVMNAHNVQGVCGQ